ncbi:P-II family nitrogen regulator [Methanocella conradii]|uniref:P-II family nitrogen regulator n=1 Tax=Methanocella conradii TaxID=1175444 RepID=UPI00157CD15D|nr:P-II family nitrogen regulator [Methanocella conradii]
MLLIRSIVRPEKKEAVLAELSKAGFHEAIVVDVVGRGKHVVGRGKHKDIKVDSMAYDEAPKALISYHLVDWHYEMPKALILMVVEDRDRDRVIDLILRTAKTGEKGAFGDGKIFISPVEEAYTISSGTKGL